MKSKINKIISISLAIVLFYPIASYAEEVPAPVETQQPQDSSAWDQESGWAVVESDGTVSNIIVCTNSVCGNDNFLNTGIQNGVFNSGAKLVRQTVSGGGYWGTYDNSTQTFTIDRSCATCEPHQDMHKAGTIKDGVVTYPVIIPGLDTFMLNNPQLTIDEAAELLKDLLQQEVSMLEAMKSSFIAQGMAKIITKKNKYRTIKLTANLKQFKKVSKTKNICQIKGNSVLILKSGTCKIDIYKDGQKERVSTKVKK